MRGAGKIIIETGRTKSAPITPERRDETVVGDLVWLSVKDNGVGMSREVLSHLFEPFQLLRTCGPPRS